MTLVAVVWGGKAGSRKQTQMGFCSKDPQTDSRVRGRTPIGHSIAIPTGSMNGPDSQNRGI